MPPRWGGGRPLPKPYPLGAFGASPASARSLAPAALDLRPPVRKSWTRLCLNDPRGLPRGDFLRGMSLEVPVTVLAIAKFLVLASL